MTTPEQRALLAALAGGAKLQDGLTIAFEAARTTSAREKIARAAEMMQKGASARESMAGIRTFEPMIKFLLSRTENVQETASALHDTRTFTPVGRIPIPHMWLMLSGLVLILCSGILSLYVAPVFVRMAYDFGATQPLTSAELAVILGFFGLVAATAAVVLEVLMPSITGTGLRTAALLRWLAIARLGGVSVTKTLDALQTLTRGATRRRVKAASAAVDDASPILPAVAELLRSDRSCRHLVRAATGPVAGEDEVQSVLRISRLLPTQRVNLGRYLVFVALLLVAVGTAIYAYGVFGNLMVVLEAV